MDEFWTENKEKPESITLSVGADPGGYRRTVPGAVLVRVKAVCILLTLLHPGGKNIGLSPTLPAFPTPNVAEYLMKHFDLRPTTTPEQELQAILR